MLAQVYHHPAGTDWRAGSPVDAEGITLTASAGASIPSLSYGVQLSQRPESRLTHATLVIDGCPVETVFTVASAPVTMTGDSAFDASSVTAFGALGHLDEIASDTGWPDTSLTALGAAAVAHITARPTFSAATGITSASFGSMSVTDTRGAGVSSDPASVDKYADEIQSLLGAITRHTVDSGMPLDWWVDTSRTLRVASPIRQGRGARLDLAAGHNCGEITESDDLSIGRIASRVIAGTNGASLTTTLSAVEGRYGVIERVASSGSAASIADALGARLRSFGVSVDGTLAAPVLGRPQLWIGDRVRVRDSSGAWASCAIVSAGLSVDDGGRSVSVNVVAAEGDW